MQSDGYPRREPTKVCQYLLETTPERHYVSAPSKIIELVLINRFGKKNIPLGLWWRLKDTDSKIYSAQKYMWQPVRRLLKTYDADIIIAMVVMKKLSFIGNKNIQQCLYWCKQVKDILDKQNQSRFKYNKEEVVKHDVETVVEKQNEEKTLLDWLEE